MVSTHSTIAKTNSRKKVRPTYSCLNCHKRKVKCDRVKPCGACCLRGTPSECEYGNSKQDRHYIEQSTLIDNLVQSCDSLKQQLAETRRLANLPPVKEEETSSFSTGFSGSTDEDDAKDSLDEYKNQMGPFPSQSQSPPLLQAEAQKLANPSRATALVEVLVDQLIKNFSPDMEAPSGGGRIQLQAAAEMRVFSPILCSAFEAASLTFVGSRDQNKSLEVAGNVRYVRVLRLLQNALYSPKDSKETDVLLTVFLSTIIEAFRNNSKDSLFKHQLGGLQLLNSRTPYRHRYGIERSLFVDLRLYWVTAALVQRKPTFLATKKWLTVPWPEGAHTKDILQRLLDVAVNVPAYLSQIDEFSSFLRTMSLPTSQLVELQTNIWETATELDTRLQVWKTSQADTYHLGQFWEETDSDSSDGFPVFRCRNQSTLQTTVPPILVYPDLLLATSMCFYWAMRLVVSTTDSGLVNVLTLQERYQFGCNICRSMKYYIQNIPGCLVSRMMFVLRTAFDMFADGMMEKQFVTELFQYIGKKFEFPVFSDRCSSSSINCRDI
ncbi:hypothetical protein ASPWEDRAFT_102964 [Aspergillus wentii DTO 134E9]|uniref:Zn(2)-C6 fungal-type domain-containing protein n=1 Tax=Aspergillus wentii DTO 134E9 TaxID=1073089 RepID=A0A1L9RY80_ASPWE|nr:uncharacterized protein ASPWEDRAFT_102964 [Aspergillus wentii DTO 134E9]OJJ39920.1 hypothetical protein ASPWEDRAFT_102964 [Aspergillus wentii DTO 134E9]